MRHKTKIAALVAAAAFALALCTGCSGMTTAEMAAQAGQLQKQSEKLNQSLAQAGNEMNQRVLSGEFSSDNLWESLAENKGLVILYAPAETPEELSTVEQTGEFIEQLSLEEWSVTTTLPDNLLDEVVFYLQEPDTATAESADNTVLTLRYFPHEGCAAVTVMDGNDAANENSQAAFTQMYLLPASAVEYLQAFCENELTTQEVWK